MILSYPVHCAVLGGSLEILQWLVDTHCCPLRSIRISGKTRQSSGSFTPILTSRGRSLLGIALEKESIDVVRYLVVDKGMPLAGEKNLDVGTLIRVLDRILRVLPPNATTDNVASISPGLVANGASRSMVPGTPPPTRLGSAPDTGSSRQTEESWRSDEALAYELTEQSRREQDSQGSVDDAVSLFRERCRSFGRLYSNFFPHLSPAVYYLLCQLNRLCGDSLRASNLLHAVQH